MIRILFLFLIVMSSVAFAQTEEQPKAVKIDEFETATNGYVKMKMDYFYTELGNNPSAQGIIFNYGTDREIAIREKQIRVSIQWRKFDAARITFVRGGFRETVKTEFWMVPPGAENPQPDSTAQKFDEFKTIDYEYTLNSIQNFYVTLGENPNWQGIILNYGSPNEIAARERRLKKYITAWNLILSRVTFKTGGFEKAGRTELWLIQVKDNNEPKSKVYVVPPDAENPEWDSTARKFDEFGRIPSGELKARVDNFFVEMGNNPDLKGYILNFGSAQTIAREEKRIRDYIRFRNSDPARITFKNGGSNKIGKTEFWLVKTKPKTEIKTKIYIVPPGAKPPNE